MVSKFNGLAAAVFAIVAWSLTPLLTAAAGSSPVEIFVIAAGVASLTSVAYWVFLWCCKSRIISNWKVFIINSIISGVFLAVWYVFYYAALKDGGSEVIIISFCWTLIAVISTPLITRKPLHSTPLMWLLLCGAFVLAGIVVWQGSTHNGSMTSIIFAFIAAIGSGLYLPFAMNAMETVTGNQIRAATTVLSVANVSAFLLTVCALPFLHPDFSKLTESNFLWAVVIGVLIYVIAEISWAFGFSRANSVAVAGLPYLTVALSVLLTVMVLGQSLSIITACCLIGLIIINVLLQFLPSEMSDKALCGDVSMAENPVR